MNTHILRASALTVLALTSSFGQALAASPAPTSWEIAGQFNRPSPCNSSPGVVWSYGKKSTVNGTFVPMNNTFNQVGPAFVRGCRTSASMPLPAVGHSTLTVPNTYLANVNGTITLEARAMWLHPGPSGELAVARFTAPYTGRYNIHGRFYGIDANGTQTISEGIIETEIAGTPTTIWTGPVDVPAGINYAGFSSQTVSLNAGDKIDFEVGFGSNNNYLFDATGVHGVIEYCQVQPSGVPC